MKKIIESSELPENENVFLKKTFGEWVTVFPGKDIKTGKRIWKNQLFGGWNNLFNLTMYLLIIGLLMFGFWTQVEQYRDRVENPELYCSIPNEVIFADEVDLRLAPDHLEELAIDFIKEGGDLE